MTNTYTIYKRITPDNYVYIGCTVRDLAVRAGYKGAGYIGQPFYDKIQEVGWENITTEVIAQTDNINEAKRLESEAIQTAIAQYGQDHLLNSELNSHYAWNEVNRKTTGVRSKAVKRSEEWKAKISATITEQWKDDERKTQIINAVRRNWQNKSKEEMDYIRAKFRDRTAHLLTDPQYRANHKQACNTPEYKTRLSEVTKDRVWVTNGIENHLVKGPALDHYLQIGFRYGVTKKQKKNKPPLSSNFQFPSSYNIITPNHNQHI